jgi:cytochrome c-type biogenesis protein CcmH/NrfG
MSNLAATYSELGRHADALAMKEQALEFRRRVLPADDPEIGEWLRVKGWVTCGMVCLGRVLLLT